MCDKGAFANKPQIVLFALTNNDGIISYESLFDETSEKRIDGAFPDISKIQRASSYNKLNKQMGRMMAIISKMSL